jgi:CHAD domain-containing protein
MEIEAKFAVRNRKTFQHLLALEDLCGHQLRAPQVRKVHDTYLDTADRRVLAAGYFCRQRASPQGILITLKALTPPTEAVHHREEWETSSPGNVPLAEWPAGPVRDHLLQWVGDGPLTPLVELYQTRHVRTVMQGERTIAELSLDQVRLVAKDRRRTILELEIELKEQGNESDLATLAACLRTESALSPEPRSKFERALAFLEGPPRVERLLRPDERATLLRIAARDGRYGRRARALLALDEGASVREAAQRAPLSPPRIRHWLRLLQQRRLDIFPPRLRDVPPDRAEPVVGPQSAAAEEPPAQPALLQIQLPENPGIEADDSMAEAARKTLYFHLQRMLYHEPGTRLGENIEELHDMRVATRRMRAALRVFHDYLDWKKMAPFAKGLRRAGRTLGTVRDLDVFHDKMQTYLGTLPAERKAELDPLLAAWQARREQARQEMITYLDSARYVRFREQFGQFLQAPAAATASNPELEATASSVSDTPFSVSGRIGWAGALPPLTQDGDLIPQRVRHVVPVVVQVRLASVRAHGEWVAAPDTPLERFHCLRIASKELRYALEFFQEVLGPESKALIATMKALQDHLGNLQDAIVACNLLRDFLTWGTWGREEDADHRSSPVRGLRPRGANGAPPRRGPWPSTPIVAPGVATYLAVRQTEIQNLVQTFPPVWAQVASRTFQKKLEAALRHLW